MGFAPGSPGNPFPGPPPPQPAVVVADPWKNVADVLKWYNGLSDEAKTMVNEWLPQAEKTVDDTPSEA